MMGSTAAGRTLFSILLRACLLFVPSPFAATTTGGNGDTGPVVEIVSFEVPEIVRALTRQVRPPKDTWINIKDFGAKNSYWKPERVNLTQGISFNMTLENDGELAGAVTVTINCSGVGEIFRRPDWSSFLMGS